MTSSDADLVRHLAFTSMLLAFLDLDFDSSADKIGRDEEATALSKALLEFIGGQPPFMTSILFLWKVSTHALAEMEHRFFPDMPVSTCNVVASPAKCLALSRISDSQSGNNSDLYSSFTRLHCAERDPPLDFYEVLHGGA